MQEEKSVYRIVQYDKALKPYEKDIELRMDNYKRTRAMLTEGSLSDFANAWQYYGFHRTADGWVYREWAPAADALYLMGDFNNWDQTALPMTRLEEGNWELHLPADALSNGSRVRTVVQNGDRLTNHIPLYAQRVVQDSRSFDWLCEVWDASEPYPWTDQNFVPDEHLFIYEAHVGMATEEYRPGTYREFADNVLPRVQDLGYNTIQLMAVMEHPYYGSFGYQVSSFYAASSRFGMPDDLRYLVNRAHEMGITVLLDVVHSHAVRNTVEGINEFDGTDYQFFHAGAQGDHPAWGTKCFNYGKPEVLHFLLSNLKFWMTEYHFDGFRFDGVTSMLYHDHALGSDFSSLAMYFSMNTDTEAVTYLQLANELIREVNPRAISIAEDMSGMPGTCVPVRDGGIGFDYRLAMGLPDMWINLITKQRDENWSLDWIWHELTARMAATIAYVESHDQALVGDKTVIFRLADANMYTDMDKICHNTVIDRAIALHKLLRLVTMAAGGNGYLNFMGNEFGHPEWIDFPREGNGWSYHYCRRQWSLVENGFLKYGQLNAFDKAMIHAARGNDILADGTAHLLLLHQRDHILAFERGGLVFVFNFDPRFERNDYVIPVTCGQDHEVLFTSDDEDFGGFGRIGHEARSAYVPGHEGPALKLGLPPRTAMVLRPVKVEE
ncbi:MAG: alpha amylase C-terminal domain-containing protein [Oscillospiraceae bacterium]|nr:alpha amylase C-terminal domain-containing protein [Oscillospiraceae bacterium]